MANPCRNKGLRGDVHAMLLNWGVPSRLSSVKRNLGRDLQVPESDPGSLRGTRPRRKFEASTTLPANVQPAAPRPLPQPQGL